MSLRSCLLAATYLSALATPALADEAALIKRLDALQRMLEEQSRQIEAQKSEIGTLKQQLGAPAVSAAPAPPSVPLPAPRPSALETRVATQQAQIEQLSTRLETAQNDARLAKADTPV